MSAYFQERDAKILAALEAGGTHRGVAAEFGVTIHIVRNALKFRSRAQALAPAQPQGALALYEAMVLAIAAAKAVDEAKDIADRAEAMRIYARQAKNREAEIDAAEIRIRAERRIGELISEAKAVGQVAEGRPAKTVATDDSFSRVRLKEAGIDRDLSSRAQKLAALPPDEFAWQLSGWRDQAREEGARVTVRLIRGEAQRTKAEARAVKEELLGRQIMKLPEQKFGVILADPPWRFEPYSRETGMDRAADNHYPTLGDIPSMADVSRIAADDCACFLWATVPMLPHALLTLHAWGFDYRSHFIWAKDRIGTGYWNRNRHELLLVGVKGNIPAPAMGTQFDSVIEAAVGRHSEKPEVFLELIERYFPTLPKIELNRRGPARPGWSAWGNEVEEIAIPGSGPLLAEPETETGAAARAGDASAAEIGEVCSGGGLPDNPLSGGNCRGENPPLADSSVSAIRHLETPALLKRSAA
jgi:N6-adenosine-specific RNA methylase IME4